MRLCYLRVFVYGQAGYLRKPFRVVGDASTPTFTASKTAGLGNSEQINVTLGHMPPRRWGYLIFCLDPDRQRTAQPADGDAITGCIRLLQLHDTHSTPTWPPELQQITVDVPRFLQWAGTDYDCAESGGCDLMLITGSNIDPDNVQRLRLNFTA
jgi:hypothetical protein